MEAMERRTWSPGEHGASLIGANMGFRETVEPRIWSVPMPAWAAVATWLALIASGAAVHGSSGQASTIDEVLARAVVYVAEYEKRFSAVVSEERYVQRASGGGTVETRQLRSDVILMPTGEPGWLIFRDVYEVDGRPVRDRDDRVLKLLLQPPPDAYAQARRIAEEGARFNIGSIQRTINTPTLALTFLRREIAPRSDFRLAGRENVEGVSAIVLRFQERDKPRVVQTKDGAAARGRFWIEPVTGCVLKTELELNSAGMSAVILVTYARQPPLDLWVPVRMVERYRMQTEFSSVDNLRDLRSGGGMGGTTLTIEGTATYGNFRRFSVDVTTIIR
jgi:hypothetical protein